MSYRHRSWTNDQLLWQYFKSVKRTSLWCLFHNWYRRQLYDLLYKLHKLFVFTFWTSPLTLYLSISFSMGLLFIKLVCKKQNNLPSTGPSNTRLLLPEASNGHLSGVGLICDRVKYKRRLSSFQLNRKYQNQWQIQSLCKYFRVFRKRCLTFLHLTLFSKVASTMLRIA